MGPPGSGRKENALALAEYFSWTCISIGDLLKKEVSKKSDYGKAIADCFKHYRYGIAYYFTLIQSIVDDHIVIELVKK
jgi:adenylate kinase family enzyme